MQGFEIAIQDYNTVRQGLAISVRASWMSGLKPPPHPYQGLAIIVRATFRRWLRARARAGSQGTRYEPVVRGRGRSDIGVGVDVGGRAAYGPHDSLPRENPIPRASCPHQICEVIEDVDQSVQCTVQCTVQGVQRVH